MKTETMTPEQLAEQFAEEEVESRIVEGTVPRNKYFNDFVEAQKKSIARTWLAGFTNACGLRMEGEGNRGVAWTPIDPDNLPEGLHLFASFELDGSAISYAEYGRCEKYHHQAVIRDAWGQPAYVSHYFDPSQIKLPPTK